MMLRNPVRTPSRLIVAYKCRSYKHFAMYLPSCRNEELHHLLRDDPNSSESIFLWGCKSTNKPYIGPNISKQYLLWAIIPISNASFRDIQYLPALRNPKPGYIF